MFGFKIISEKEYARLLGRILELSGESSVKNEDVEKLKNDCESLRQQLNDKIKEVNKLREKNNNYLHEVKSLREFKRDTLDAMGHIDLAGFQLQYCTKKCKHCENEQHDCKKYEFGKHQYCVIPK